MSDFTEGRLHRQEIYSGRVVNLTVDTVRLPDGKEGVREVVHHRGSVCIVATHEGDVFLVRQYRYPTQETLLELPAGTAEPGEEREATARREAEEEIGWRPGRMTFLFEGYVSPGYTSELQSFFLAEDLQPAVSHCDDDEFIDVVRLSWSDALQAVEQGTLRDSKTVAGLLAAAHRLGITR